MTVIFGVLIFTLTGFVSAQTNTPSNQPSLTCTANKTDQEIGNDVTWRAEPVGFSGNLTYRWTGKDEVSGTGSTLTTSYRTTGIKTAIVSVN